MKKELNFPTGEEMRSVFAPMNEAFEKEIGNWLCSLRDETEEKRMNRKLPFALALALVLIFLTSATALALTLWRDDLETLFNMSREYGDYMDEWNLDEKLMMLSVMEKNETPMDERDLAVARDKTRTDEARHLAADRILSARYGIDGRIDTITPLGIMETELGKEFAYWTVEDKAWYDQMEWQYRAHGSDHMVFTVPGEGEITQAQALSIALDAATHGESRRKGDECLEEAIPLEELQVLTPIVSYGYYPCYSAPLGEPFWTFYWKAENDWHETASVQVSWQGEVLCASFGWEESLEDSFFQAIYDRDSELRSRKGQNGWWSIEDWHYYDPDRFLLPREGDISVEQAIRLAQEALMREQGMTQAELDSRMPAVHIGKYLDLGATVKYQYVVLFTPKDSTDGRFDSYADLDSETGAVLRTYWKGRVSPAQEEPAQDSVNGFRTLEEIQSAKGENIDHWTLQERAYFLPDHGLPDARYIPESTAVRIAKRAWEASTPDREEGRVRVVAYFIISEEAYGMPYWEIRFLDQADDSLLWYCHVLADITLLNNADDPYGMREPL